LAVPGGKGAAVSADTYRVIDLVLAAWRPTDRSSGPAHLEETAA
jgi:hypothetical protein